LVPVTGSILICKGREATIASGDDFGTVGVDIGKYFCSTVNSWNPVSSSSSLNFEVAKLHTGARE
jgi:hypothetical protein